MNKCKSRKILSIGPRSRYQKFTWNLAFKQRFTTDNFGNSGVDTYSDTYFSITNSYVSALIVCSVDSEKMAKSRASDISHSPIPVEGQAQQEPAQQQEATREASAPGQERMNHMPTQIQALLEQLQIQQAYPHFLLGEVIRVSALSLQHAGMGALPVSPWAGGEALDPAVKPEAAPSASYSQVALTPQQPPRRQASVAIAVPSTPSTDQKQTSDPPSLHHPEPEHRPPASTSNPCRFPH